MGKKILCLILALCLTASCFVSVSAARYADETFVTVTVWNDQYRQLHAIPVGADLLFSAEDLAWMSGMTLTQSDTLIHFTRGFKKVSVQLIDPSWDTVMPGYEEVVSAMVSTNTKKLLSPAQKVEGTWYLSAASLLPWLNVEVKVDENKIMCRPAPDSLWDEWGSFSLKDHTFDFVTCCQEMGIRSKDVEAAAYIRNNGLKMLLDLDINNNGTTYQSTQNYMDLFDDFFMDKSATDEAISWTKAVVDDVINLTDAATIMLMLGAPECVVISEGLNKAAKTGDMFVDFYSYVSLFNEDNEQKLRIMDNFVGELIPNSVSLDKNMKKAADQIRDRYRKLWKGILQKAMSTTVDASVDALNSNVVLKMLDLKWNVDRPLNQKLNRIGMYDTIAAYAKQAHDEGFGGYSEAEIATVVDNCVLYLYCVEQNYRAMADYIAQKKVGTTELFETYTARAYAAEAAAARLLHLSLFSPYDASDTGKWSTKSKELLKGFEGLEQEYAVVSDLGVTVDNAIYVNGLTDMNLRDLRWTQADLDRDGFVEILALCEQDGEHTFFVIDANNKSMNGINVSSMQPNACALLPTADGVSYHPTYGLERGAILSWNGYEWEDSFSWDEGWVQENGEQVFKDYFYCGGEACTYEVYSQKLEAAKIRDIPYEERTASLELDCTDLDSAFFAGDPDGVIRQLDSHMKGKEGLLAAVDVNFNLDEDTDRLYIVKNAMGEMLLFSRKNDESKQLPYRSYFDLEWTLVLAERQSDGVRVRTYRVDERFLENMSVGDCTFEGEVLTIGENDFYYSADGDPFVDSQTHFEALKPCLLDFLGMPEEEACGTVDAYFDYYEGSYLDGEFDGGSIQLYFELVGRAGNKVWGLTFYPVYDGSTNIDGNYTTGNTRSELWENIFQPSEPWPALSAATDPEGNVMYYGTTFVYTYQGERYWITLSFYNDEPDSPLMAIGIMPVM